jgi:hypothetical protein
MADSRTKPKPSPRVATIVAADALGTWGITGGAVAVAVLAAGAAALELVSEPLGLAIAVLALLVLMADTALRPALAADGGSTMPVVAGIAVAWIALCYLPFHFLFFPGEALHDPIVVHGAAASLPVTLPAAGRSAIDLLLEGELPQAPGGGTGIPVAYTITIEDAAHEKQILTGRFEDNLRTQRLGRRGTATVVQAHHAERRLVTNAPGGDLQVTTVALDPAAGASVTLTTYAHRLPPLWVTALLGVLVVAGAAWVDTQLVPESTGTFLLSTAGALGAAVVLWTSNTVHPTVTNLIGSAMFGGLIGVTVGAGVWAVARRTLVHDRR